jgi:hypothetical protein
MEEGIVQRQTNEETTPAKDFEQRHGAQGDDPVTTPGIPS